MLQETAQADAVAGRSILLAILLSSVTGMAYLLGLTYCISVSCITSGYVYIVAPSLSCQLHTVQDYDHVLSLDNETGGLLPVGQVSAKLLHELCQPKLSCQRTVSCRFCGTPLLKSTGQAPNASRYWASRWEPAGSVACSA